METMQDGNGASALVRSSPSNPPSFTAINSPTSGPALTSQPTHTTSSRLPISGRGHNPAVAESLWRDAAEHLEHGRTPSPPTTQKHCPSLSRGTAAGTLNASLRAKRGNSANALAQRPAPERLKLTKASSKQVLVPKNQRLSPLPDATSSAAYADILANAVVYHRGSGQPSAYQSNTTETNQTFTSAQPGNLNDLLAPSSSSWNPINPKRSWNNPDRTYFINEYGSSIAQQSPKKQKLSLALDDTLVSKRGRVTHLNSPQPRHGARETHGAGRSSPGPTHSFGNSKDRITSSDFTDDPNTLSHTATDSFTNTNPSTDCHDRPTDRDRVCEGRPDHFDGDLFDGWLFDDGVDDDELLTLTSNPDVSSHNTGSQHQRSPDTGLECQPTATKPSCETYTRDNNPDLLIRIERGPKAQFVSPSVQYGLPVVQWIDMKPIVRLPFPAQVRERSPIIGLTSACLLRSCFRIGEAINAGKSAARTGKNVILELYARVLSSTRDDTKRRFVFGDLFHSKPPYLKGEHDTADQQFPSFPGTDDPTFWDQEHRAYRCIAKMKQSGKEWILMILNMTLAKQEDVLWVEGIVNVY